MLTRRRGSRRQRGMSLIEVMVALGVLTIGGIGTVSLMLQLFNQNRQAAKRSVSAEMARSAIDDMLAASYVTYDPATFFAALQAEPSPLAVMSCTYAGTAPGDTWADCDDEIRGLKRRITVTVTSFGTVRINLVLGWKIRAAADDRFWTQYDMEIVIPI